MPLSRWLIFTLALAIFAPAAQAQEAAYLDTRLTPAERAHNLVGRMTLDEKANQLEDWATAIPRLGIPDYQTWNEALHGVARAGYSTVFPQAIGMAATWDPAMVTAMGNVISIEARGKYNQAQREGNHRIFFGLTFWSPNINAIPAGAAARRPTARILSLLQEWVLPSSRACKAAISITSAPSPPASTSPSTVAPSSCGTASTSIPRPATWKRPICPPSAPRLPRDLCNR